MTNPPNPKLSSLHNLVRVLQAGNLLYGVVNHGKLRKLVHHILISALRNRMYSRSGKVIVRIHVGNYQGTWVDIISLDGLKLT